MRKLILILSIALLCVSCTPGHWERSGKETNCVPCHGNGAYIALQWDGITHAEYECEDCGGDGIVRSWKFVPQAEKQ